MKKEFCRYAVYDIATGVRIVCGEKYKANHGLEYVESFRCVQSHFKKVYAYGRKAFIKGRAVDIVYWFNTPIRTPYRYVLDGGLIMGLR